MRDFFEWIGKCLRMVVRHFQWTIDGPLYAASFGLPFLAWKYPDFWNSTGGQQMMNGLWWQIPAACSSSILAVRLLLSPYWVYKSAVAERDNAQRPFAADLSRLQSEVDRLKQDNSLGSLLRELANSAKAGSLSSRANILAEEMIVFANERSLEQYKIFDEDWGRGPNVPHDDPGQQKRRLEHTQKIIRQSTEMQGVFHLKYTPRILTIAEEFRAKGLTDSKLEHWISHQFLAGPHWGIPTLAVALSTMAIKLAETEKTMLG